jgi:hypothetical protein
MGFPLQDAGGPEIKQPSVRGLSPLPGRGSWPDDGDNGAYALFANLFYVHKGYASPGLTVFPCESRYF